MSSHLSVQSISSGVSRGTLEMFILLFMFRVKIRGPERLTLETRAKAAAFLKV